MRKLYLALVLLTACAQSTHEWHCPPCDVTTDGSVTTCPDPACGDDAGSTDADAGTDASEPDAPDAYEPPAVERDTVCALVDQLNARFSCGIACPSSWAPVCTGPNPDWCLNDLQTQVDSCANLAIVVNGECNTACAP
jgi:hypothetical protein